MRGGGALINYLFPRGDTWILIKWWKKASCCVSIITRNERPRGFEESSSTVTADSSNRKYVFCFFAEVVLAAAGPERQWKTPRKENKDAFVEDKDKREEVRKSQQVFSLWEI